MADATFARTPGLLGKLYEEAATGERQMREALFLTFNLDVGFFESRILGVARSTGAAVTVIADAHMFAPDPRDARSAGSAYTLGLASVPGAFHPKLTVLTGPARALVALGSGNLSVGGWFGNEELLTTATADTDTGAPALVADVADFVRRLGESQIAISPSARTGLARTARELSRLVERTNAADTGHRLVDSLRGPILEQLPAEPVDELEISAAFIDTRGHAFRSLLDLYRPSRVTLLVQPGLTVMQPDPLRVSAEGHDCALRFAQLEGDDTVGATRYRHGKLLTAIRGGSPLWHLTGSPNMSAAALEHDAASGNMEIGVVETAVGSLLPDPLVDVPDERRLTHAIQTTAAQDGDATAGGPRLLEAETLPGAIRVTMSRPANFDLAVEVSPYDHAPEDFTPLGVIPAGQTSTTFAGTYEPGSRIRIAGQLQFLTNPARTQQRLSPLGEHRPAPDVTHHELFASEAAAARWHGALTSLVLSQGKQSAAAVARGSKHPSVPVEPPSWRTLEDPDAWAEYTDRAQAHLGLPIFQIACGSASERGGVAFPSASAAPAWDDRLDDAAEAYEADQSADDVAANDTNENVVAARLTYSEQQKGRYRRWIADLVALLPSLGPLERIAGTQLCLVATGLEIWTVRQTGGPGWFETLADAAESLDHDDWPEHCRGQAASAAAIAVYRLSSALPADGRGPQPDRLRQLTERLRALLAEATEETISPNLDLLAGSTVGVVTGELVHLEVSEALAGDPRRQFLRRLERRYPDKAAVWRDEHCLILTGDVTNPILLAAEAMDLRGDEFSRLAIAVNSDRGPWAVAFLAEDRFTAVESRKGDIVWYRTYRLDGIARPLVLLTDRVIGRVRQISQPPLAKPDPVDEEMLNLFGVASLPVGADLAET